MNFIIIKISFIFEEIFMSELAYECGVECVSFKNALNNNTLGIISKLYRTNGKNYYVYSDFCDNYFGHRPNNLFSFKFACSIAFGEEKAYLLMNDIFKLISFDMFSGQWDREEHNFFFECGDDNVRLAPLCDNGIIFTHSSIYNSPFGVFSLSDNGEEKNYRNNLLRLVSFEKLAFLLDINIDEVLERTIDKYRMIISERINLIYLVILIVEKKQLIIL